MQYRLTRFGIHSTALSVAVIYFVLSLVLAPIFFLATRNVPNGGFPAIIIVIVPVGYAIVGYVGTAIACWIYNIAAGWAGGIAFTLEPNEGGRV